MGQCRIEPPARAAVPALSKADLSVVADVVVKKYLEHQPLYRQQQAFDRLGIWIPRQTLCGWTAWCSDQVEPVVKAMAHWEHFTPRCVFGEKAVQQRNIRVASAGVR